MGVITFGAPVGAAVNTNRPRVEITSLPQAGRRVIIRSHIDAITGYGQLACQLIRGIQKNRVEVGAIPMQVWEQWGLNIPSDVQSVVIKSGEMISEGWELLLAPPHHGSDEAR